SKNRGQQGMAPGVGMQPHPGMVPNSGPPGVGVGDQGQGVVPDPMNALQVLARQGGQPPQQQVMMGPQHGMRQQMMQQAAMMQQRGQMPPRPQLQATQQQQVRMQQRAGLQKPPLERQDAFIVTSSQNVQPVSMQGLTSTVANLPFQSGGPLNSMVRTMAMGGPPGQMPQQQQYMQPGSQPMSIGPDLSPAMQSLSSPAPGLPSQSPQPQIAPSPAGRGMYGAPSPSTVLNTPGTPGASVPSPSSMQHATPEDQAYLEKLSMLSKYVEPLRRSVNNLEKNTDEESRKNYMKMKNLLDILTDTNKRVSMTTLLRCEQALNNWNIHTKPTSSSRYIGQDLIDAIAEHIDSPTLNHTLQRTFGPVMAAFLGERIGFRVSLDPLHHPNNKTIHLVCKLDDANLPSVPPVLVTVPPQYPSNSPVCEPKSCPGYDASAFFESIADILTQMLRRMPNYSLATLLQNWEMSVRKACAPSLSVDTSILDMFA
ncbi:hypothetical protein BaRGS_00025056, partial [Batillaria attramentaria]